MKTKHLLLLASVIVMAVTYFWLTAEQGEKQEKVWVEVLHAPFASTVTATGELKAKHSEKIRGPRQMRSVEIYNTTIQDMIDEGTVVDSGQYVASLDKSEIATKMATVQAEIDKINTQLEQAKIDTAIELRSLRDQMINLQYQLEEKAILVKQSKYEAKMIIRQAELDLERVRRDLAQNEVTYELKLDQARAKISEFNASLRQQYVKMKSLEDIAEAFVIKAPKSGMLIYASSWNGKIGPGSQISAWNPTVAELPDLTDMVSKTYVNEVDISKVKEGQRVTVSVDAFPEKSFDGEVISIANIGQEIKGRDSRVFEVMVQMLEIDSTLRPAMTTGNDISIYETDSALSIPLEALYDDSLSFVICKVDNRIVKKEVLTGEVNENRMEVLHGLEAGTQVFIGDVEEFESIDIELLDPSIKADILARFNAQKAAFQEAIKKNAKKDKKPPQLGQTSERTVIMIN